VVADVYDPAVPAWKTILVAGLNKGGKAYYALDVTDPDNPKALWEFKWSNICYSEGTASTHGADCHLGYSFGKPVITKLKDGTWVALVTSGYNNVSAQATGDGEGYLYVLNAVTGKIISKISTGNGDATTPSGLAQINAFIDNATVDNTARYVYGGDNNGNVWRFEINPVADDPLTTGVDETVVPSATLLGVTKDASERIQPITTRPELGEIEGKPWLFVGTGRLLGSPDLTDVYTQSVYAFADPLGAYTPTYPDPTDTADPDIGTAGLRSILRPLAISPKTAANANPAVGTTRTVACTGTTAECARASGWVVDLPDDGERININMNLALGTLVFASNVPRNTACNIGGYSWFNFLDSSTGLAVPGSPSNNVSAYLGEYLAVGVSLIQLPSSTPGGQGKLVALVQGSGGGTPTPIEPPVSVDKPLGRRVSWREIAQ
jgi:type IV pilus assembly protein PilY1